MEVKLTKALILLLLTVNVYSDMYLHNPRGSNNRLDEEGRNRNNANRMFDSQNNDRGGYNVGSLYYYEGSKLQIEWTNQHSCAGPNNHCEIILQYMCDDTVRDGARTSTIPQNPLECQGYNCNSDTRYGMNEDYMYYMRCKTRERNKGLFTADQNLRGNTAKYTRQNPGGTRRGYECPEERDYYPYWHPTPWKDIAILTNDATRCPYYEAESENVKGRGECIMPSQAVMKESNNRNLVIPNTKEECEQFKWPANDANGARGVWKENPAHNIPAPACRENQFSRDNHLGNGPGGYPDSFNWTIPEINHERCVLRIRYNISTEDYPAWGDITAENNKQKGKKAANLDLHSRYNLGDASTAASRGYEFKNNPQVEIFPNLDNFKLQLAINTAQYGRTFQDRSHTFAVRKRPTELQDVTIHNVNVRGKRGNIVQVYPAVEYDFVPNTLNVMTNEYVHFQWTGSNTNPHNNDGQGRAGTDRSNVLLQGSQVYAEGTTFNWYGDSQMVGHWGRSYPALLSNTTFLGLSSVDRMNLALLTNVQFRGEMSELDDAGTYFDLGPKKVTSTGVYHYMCTRNNNFSNRSQKGRIACRNAAIHETSVGWNGGNVTLPDGGARIRVKQGDFSKLQTLRLERWKPEDGKEKLKKIPTAVLPPSDSYHSDYLFINPQEKLTVDDKKITVEMMVTASGTFHKTAVYHAKGDHSEWFRLESVEYKDGWASIQTETGGTYVVLAEPDGGAIAGLVIGLLILIAIVVVAAIFLVRRNPETMSRVTRGFQNKI